MNDGSVSRGESCAMKALGGVAVTGYSLCNGLGRTTEEVIASLAASRSGLGPPPFPLPFETVCGTVPGELSAPPAEFSRYDSRQMRIALQTLAGIRTPLAEAFRRWGADRLGISRSRRLSAAGGLIDSESCWPRARVELPFPRTPTFPTRRTAAYRQRTTTNVSTLFSRSRIYCAR